MKIYMFAPKGAPPPFLLFQAGLDDKPRRKLAAQLQMLQTAPMLKEPHVKHFTIEKYKRLYEIRARSKAMIRVIFTRLESGDILLLAAFVKKQPRNTMRALDLSLRMLSQIESDAGLMRELPLSPSQSEQAALQKCGPFVKIKN